MWWIMFNLVLTLSISFCVILLLLSYFVSNHWTSSNKSNQGSKSKMK